MKCVALIFGLCWIVSAVAQENFLSIHSFYKDQVFANKLQKPLQGGAFFPITESDYNLIPAINDSSKQYYKVTYALFKSHLFELKGDTYFLAVSPIFDFSYGSDFSDTSGRRLFQNTRGFLIEGDLLKKLSFSTSFYENQASFANYENRFYESHGELYPSDTLYATQNAVVPGAGRTKYFKANGFDYAYAVGNIVYRPFEKWTFSTGNNAQFIGSGHRSLLLSDNSYSAPYFRVDWEINSKLHVQVMRAKLLNLLRRPNTNSAESYYEPKGYSVNYLTYMPTKSVQLSLFEGAVWNRGDSVSSEHVNPLFYSPVPGLANILSSNEVNVLLGLDWRWQVAVKHLVYGQLAVPNLNFERTGFQAGYRGYNLFRLNDFMVQLEYNFIPSKMYASSNPRLNYTHYNLPLGHIRGDGVQEVLVRSNYEHKRMYIDFLLSYQMLRDYNIRGLLPSNALADLGSETSFNVLNTQLELGYRFNRKMNFSAFVRTLLRTSSEIENRTTSVVQIGLRTGIVNQYKDF